jgi:hypothetical protein
MIKCMFDGENGQAQPGGFAVLRGLQHILSSQRSRGLVTQGKRILQELKDLGSGFQVLRTVPAHEVRREFIAGQRPP